MSSPLNQPSEPVAAVPPMPFEDVWVGVIATSQEVVCVDGTTEARQNCSRCGHSSPARISVGLPSASAARRNNSGASRQLVTVRCTCEAEHPDADGKKGCGARFRIWVTA